ncbi:MAG: metallopeptidase family protein [Candidatus Abyssobacteria bacterium SURF_5]|uniref:Metallopeptidase family protein n=1 Tax=Abyssobacteria bacterium (strain SURF_5) TaxID=2093360 RepID=A0A3A4NNJ2_ABYX5|nr:MAG: metallopeptidase family protein [Candidatus Abyssubacteria bacterium SURF_5]
MKISRKKFEEIVAEALDELPGEIAEAMTNVFVVVEEWPSRDLLDEMGLQNRYELLGVYEGIPLLQRTTSYSALPDRIVLFQAPIQSSCSSDRELREEIKKVVVHEVAHHFGISDRRLRQLGY